MSGFVVEPISRTSRKVLGPKARRGGHRR